MGTLIDEIGATYGKWTVIARGENIKTSAGWLCRCECGGESLVRGADLRSGKSTNCGCVRNESVAAVGRGRFGHLGYNWRGDSVCYVAAHSRVKALRGKAVDHPCADCGQRAHDWSYTGGCPRELTSERGVKYSPDPSRYVPRCQSCHCEFDGRNARRDERGRFANRD